MLELGKETRAFDPCFPGVQFPQTLRLIKLASMDS
jgi:hypothetical protein